MSTPQTPEASKSSLKGFGRHCSVRGCTYNDKKLCELQNRLCFYHKPTALKDCPCDPPYKFHFPKNAEQRREWLLTLQLKCPPKKLYVCSYHFIDKQPTEQNPLPQLMVGYKRTVKQGRRIVVRQTQEPSKLQRGGKRKASSTEGSDIPEKRCPEENDTVEGEECIEDSDSA